MLAISIDDAKKADGCFSCCCESVALKPGATEPLRLNYAPWVLPFAPRGIHCAPDVDIEEKPTCDTSPANQPPQVSTPPIKYAVTPGTPLTEDLTDKVVDPETQPLTFRALGLYGPQHGKLVLNADGTFTYTAAGSYSGPDRFFASASDGINSTVFEVLLGVNVPVDTLMPTPDFSVGPAAIDNRYFTVVLPLIASPAARTCQVFRVTIRACALSCECDPYYHIDCVDVRIVKC